MAVRFIDRGFVKKKRNALVLFGNARRQSALLWGSSRKESVATILRPVRFLQYHYVILFCDERSHSDLETNNNDGIRRPDNSRARYAERRTERGLKRIIKSGGFSATVFDIRNYDEDEIWRIFKNLRSRYEYIVHSQFLVRKGKKIIDVLE